MIKKLIKKILEILELIITIIMNIFEYDDYIDFNILNKTEDSVDINSLNINQLHEYILKQKNKKYCITNNNFKYCNKCNLCSKLKIEYEKYDENTNKLYKSLRYSKLDPITYENISEDLLFKFEYLWDPITGERLFKDIYGPLNFNVLTLATSIYYNRLRLLWNNPTEEFEGFYGDGLCAGEDLYLKSRGNNKHLHIFRLPIIDCYIPKNFSRSIITMSPILTLDEINLIQTKLNKYYIKNPREKKIDLVKINLYYNKAIDKKATLKEAMNAVEILKKM